MRGEKYCSGRRSRRIQWIFILFCACGRETLRGFKYKEPLNKTPTADDGSFPPIRRFEKREICRSRWRQRSHTDAGMPFVGTYSIPSFSNLVLTKNLSPSAAADLIRASSDFYENGLFALPPAGDQHISCSSIYFMIYFFPYMVNLRFFNFIRNF